MPRVLLTAFHYPPLTGSSGVHRTLTFSRYLPEHGWEPVVLSAHPRAYEQTGSEQMGDVPEGIEVRRAFALDTKRHLSVRGRYAAWMALPDRWVTWALGAVPAGLRLIRRHRPSVIWTTYPIATAHLIGWLLHRLTGLPWIADFRDSMTEPGYPADPRQFRCFRWIERKAVTAAFRSVFTTPGAVRMYAERYPDVAPERWALLPNGYEEAPFADAAARLAPRRDPGRTTLVHSGMLYPKERDPRAFFAAVAALKAAGEISADSFRVVLRGATHEEAHAAEIRRHGIGDLVRLEPPIAYREALAELLAADGLLLFQAANCNHQVPAKLYEYFRAGRPVLGLTDPAGDTAATMREAGLDTIVRLDDRDAIVAGLRSFLARVRAGTAPVVPADAVGRYSRRGRAAQLGQLLAAAAGRPAPGAKPRAPAGAR